MKEFLRKIYWFFISQLGLDPLLSIKALLRTPSYLCDFWRFKRSYNGRLSIKPCLHDHAAAAGAIKNEYFWQDLLVARMVNNAAPVRHADIGSRLDGFVTHVAAFREIEVFDIRPLSVQIPGVRFVRVDLMDANSVQDLVGKTGYYDSVSCLHAIEHFGLGRYGDSIDIEGYRQGIANLALLLEPNGILYLSTPIGRERVEFNANWVFYPQTIIDVAAGNGLELKALNVVKSDAAPERITPSDTKLADLAEEDYNLGCFIFEKSKT